jgi:hypothetical protein
MTECSTQLELPLGVGRRVVGVFDGGRITSDGGIGLVSLADRKLGLSEGMVGCLRDGRQRGKVRHEMVELLRQRVYLIAAGYEDCNDSDSLREDPAVKLAVGRLPEGGEDLASQPTLSRFENRITRRELWQMGEVFVESWIRGHGRHAPREIILDFDATDDETHGQQQLTFFHGYYEHYCYLPLLVTAQAEEKGEQELIAAVLRPGNKHAGYGAKGVLRRIVERLRRAFPRARIIMRGDSGMALPEIYEWCEGNGIEYVIGLARNERLEALGESLLSRARAEYQQTQQKVKLFGEFCYAAQSWSRERRVVQKAEVMSQGDNPRFVVTNREQLNPEELYRFYTARGDMENRIKELKLQMKADRTSCHRFLANQFRLFLHAAAFALLQSIRQHLYGTELHNAEVTTLRLRLIKIGARVTQSVRRVVFHWASGYPWKNLLRILTLRLAPT